MQYIEMNPVRTNMVDHPAKYRWSSFAANPLVKAIILFAAMMNISALATT
jgi:putative transposase